MRKCAFPHLTALIQQSSLDVKAVCDMPQVLCGLMVDFEMSGSPTPLELKEEHLELQLPDLKTRDRCVNRCHTYGRQACVMDPEVGQKRSVPLARNVPFRWQGIRKNERTRPPKGPQNGQETLKKMLHQFPA